MLWNCLVNSFFLFPLFTALAFGSNWASVPSNDPQWPIVKVIRGGYVSWFGAENLCADEGGRLAVVTNADSNEAIRQLLVGAGCGYSGWFGLIQGNGAGSPNEPFGDWCWLDQTCQGSGRYTNYDDRMDNFNGAEHCGEMLTIGTWNDFECWGGRDCVICERQYCPEGTFLIVGTGCGLCPAGTYSHIETATCDLCPPGKFSIAAQQTSCIDCEPGFGSDLGAQSCEQCLPGKYLTDGTCAPCPSGYGSEYRSTTCTICPAGKYSLPGSGCIVCEPGRYSQYEGSSECLSCLGDSILNSTSLRAGTKSFEDCIDCNDGYFLAESGTCTECALGSYSDNTTLNNKCDLCPKGRYAIAQGLSSAEDCIMCESGKWSNSLGSTTIENCKACPFIQGLSCPKGSPVPFVEAGYFRSRQKPDEIRECVPQAACPTSGFNETSCATGYIGDLCSNCEPYTYYRKDLFCLKCENQWGRWLLLVAVFVFGMLLMFLMSTPQEKFVNNMRVTIQGIQFLAILPRLSDEWASSLLFFLRGLSLLNLDLQVFSFECTILLGYWNLWILKLLLPVFVFSWLMTLFLSTKLLSKLSSKPRYVKDLSQYIYCFISIFQLLYLYLIASLAEPFQCLKQPDDTYTMIAHPEVECYSAEWKSYVYSFGLCIGLVYIVVVPGVLVYIFSKNRPRIHTDAFSSKYGALFRTFKEEYYWYEAVVTLRKFAVVFLPDILSFWISGNVRILTSLIASLFFLVVDSVFMPYRRSSKNFINLSFASIVIFAMMSSFVSSRESGANSNEIRAMTAIILISSIATILLGAIDMSLSILDKSRRKTVGAAKRDRVGGTRIIDEQ